MAKYGRKKWFRWGGKSINKVGPAASATASNGRSGRMRLRNKARHDLTLVLFSEGVVIDAAQKGSADFSYSLDGLTPLQMQSGSFSVSFDGENDIDHLSVENGGNTVFEGDYGTDTPVNNRFSGVKNIPFSGMSGTVNFSVRPIGTLPAESHWHLRVTYLYFNPYVASYSGSYNPDGG